MVRGWKCNAMVVVRMVVVRRRCWLGGGWEGA